MTLLVGAALLVGGALQIGQALEGKQVHRGWWRGTLAVAGGLFAVGLGVARLVRARRLHRGGAEVQT